MKKSLTLSFLLLITCASVNAQANVQLKPSNASVCFSTELYVTYNGNSFSPTSYQWSTGETTPTIQIFESDTYTVTVTGYLGNSKVLTTMIKSAYYNVLDNPNISPLSNLWVCKGDTVKLASVQGYDAINWSNGAIGELFEREMNYFNSFGLPELDTLSVSYTATLNGVCTVSSETVVLRGIRKPNGVGSFYQGKMNINSSDSIPAGLILEYMYPVTYEMTFTDVANPSSSIKYVTAPGSRRAPASMLTPGAIYSVETIPVINGITFCSGTPSLIGIASPLRAASGNRLSLGSVKEEGTNTYTIYDISGRLLMQKIGEELNYEWLLEIAPQMLIIHKTGQTNEVYKMQLMR